MSVVAGSTTAQPLEALIAALEAALAGLAAEPSLEDVARFVEERSDTVMRLAALDLSSLTASERTAVADRLRRVMDADQFIERALAARREEIVAELARVGHARRVAGSTRSGPGPVRRVA